MKENAGKIDQYRVSWLPLYCKARSKRGGRYNFSTGDNSPQGGESPDGLCASMPSRRASMPSRRASMPSRRASMPSRRASMPGRRASMPSRRASMPGRRASMPGRRASMPGRRASMLSHRASMPSRRASMLSHRASMPIKKLLPHERNGPSATAHSVMNNNRDNVRRRSQPHREQTDEPPIYGDPNGQSFDNH